MIMNDKNGIQEPSGSVTTKAEDKIVTDGRTTVKPAPNQQIQKRYMNLLVLIALEMSKEMGSELKRETTRDE
ncbi:MAG TPA: hypothetical protein VE971_01980 [Candidatus Eisenbacteria bacterium]|nr:hypothetical protein [Candidatus Eisenbacteria bacterium]